MKPLPRHRLATALLGAVLLTASAASATDYFVRVSGSDLQSGLSPATAFLTIQRAADVMLAGDTAYVGGGTYDEEVESVVDGSAGSPIRFVADTSGAQTGDAGPVAIDLSSGGYAFDFLHSHHHLGGFQISNGKGIRAKDVFGLIFDELDVTDSGEHGFKLENTTSTIRDCTVATPNDMGFEIKGTGTVLIEDCSVTGAGKNGIFVDKPTVTVRRTTVVSSGDEGIRVREGDFDLADSTIGSSGKEGLRQEKGNLTMSGSDIANSFENGLEFKGTSITVSDASITASGKIGLLVSEGDLDLTDSTIGSSGEKGILHQNGSLVMSGSRIETSTDEGLEFDGVSIDVSDSSITGSGNIGLLVKEATTASFDRLEVSDSLGTGMHLEKTTAATVTNVVVARNTLYGVYVKNDVGTIAIWHATIVGNTSHGIWHRDTPMTVRNSVVVDNQGAGLHSDDDTGLSHSTNLFFGNLGGHFSGTSAGPGELFVDPQFVGATDFHLQETSPAIDTGTDASAVTTQDLDAVARPYGPVYDMGAYETEYSRLDHFTVVHDGYGVYCLAESLVVTARDANGDPVDDYTGQITLTTQSSNGTWLAIAPSAGPFADPTADDGLATYTFDDADDGVATFTLSYGQGNTPIDVDVFQTDDATLRDDDSEGSLAFGPSGFLLTGGPISNPPPAVISSPVPTQVAGTSFPVYLTAYGQTPTDPTCGVIETYTGAQPVKFWSDYDDPTTGTLTPRVDGTPIAASMAAASPQAVVFSSGQATISVQYKDVGQISLHALDDTVAEPVAGIGGSTSPFVVRPSDLVVVAVERPDTSSNPGASTPSGDVFVPAGSPFRVTVEVRDSEGDRTPNFGQEIVPEGLILRSSQLVAPAGGRNGTSGTGALLMATSFSPAASPGAFEGSSFAFDEVGAIRLRANLADASYLATGDLAGTPSGIVGRFVPSYLDAVVNAPLFQTSCLSGAFTYVGESFDYVVGSEPEVTVTARNLQGGMTENYEGSWFRLSAADLTNLAYTAATGTLTPGAPNAPTVTSSGSGAGSILFDQGPALAFQRVSPTAPFPAEIRLAFDLQDADGIAEASNPVELGDAALGLGIDWSGGKEQRFGRLHLTPAHGSELLSLPVPLRAEHWNGTAFVANATDQCTALSAANLSVTPTPGSLSTTPSLANVPVLSGDAGLSLSAPGAGNTGHADLFFDLGGAALPWLLGDWDGDGLHLENPTGRATFGIHSGDRQTIYVRDVY